MKHGYVSKEEIEKYLKANPPIHQELKKLLFDLGLGDVHAPSAVHVEESRMKYQFNDKFECADDCSKEMTRLNAAKECGDVDDAMFTECKGKIEEASKKFLQNGSLHVPTAAVITPEMSDRFHGDVIILTDEDVAHCMSDESKKVWIQVAKQGKFRGHASGHPFEMNLQTFEEIIRNFKSTVNQQIPVDFEHASEQDSTEGTIPSEGAPAQGWIFDLKVGNDGNLYGLVEWLPLARRYIKAKQYKFLSPAVVFGAKDRVTGKPIGARLSSVALTNNPFLDGMAPLAAKHREKDRASFFRKLLSLSSSMSDEEVFKTVHAFFGMDGETVSNKDGQGPSMGTRPPNIEENNMSDLAKQVSELSTQLAETKVTLSATEKKSAEAQTEIVTLTNRAQNAEAKVAEVTMSLKEETSKREALETENTALKTKIDEIEVKQFNMRLDEAFETYKDARKLTDEDKDMMRVFLKASPDKFEARFPKVAADKRHLMRDLSNNKNERKDATENTVPGDGSQGRVINLADAALALSRQRGIPLDAAQRILLNSRSKKSG